ncbi:helix-turn-helix transcriptional regulator [Methylophaga sp. OBS1]|uniref:helix-turn-helix transcriptional regulator n=1 Tax=Methylophaga sp. OBS1 TaxID=2991933 RepID=UPI002256482E|nr:AraC family transcriptional regulator [Methylophaga sp. OBS1]
MFDSLWQSKRVSEVEMNRTEKPIKSSDLRHWFSRYSAVSNQTHDDVVLEGVFHHNLNCDGLAVHGGKLVEMQDFTSFVELPAALSFNIVFEGQVDFSIGQRNYQLGNNPDVPVECSVIIINQPEVLIRHFRKGMRVCKVNLFAERHWLEKRANIPSEKQRLARLFAQHAAFHYWQPSAQIIDLARRLMAINEEASLRERLRAESISIDLLACCMQELEAKPAFSTPTTKSRIAESASHKKLKQKIDDMLLQPLSLNDMAGSMGLSISTLQRKFKSAYGVTVNSYCRQRRLDMAKKALIMEGKSIGEAAYLAGYNHPSNFIAAFKKRFSITPSEFINMSRSP